MTVDFMKKTSVLLIMFLGMAGLTACAGDNVDTNMVSSEKKTDKIHDDIEAGNIRHVNIGGNAKSIIIKQGADKYFKFHNEDLDNTHTYEVHCDEKDDTLDIEIMMEEEKADNNILGSFVIDIPEKEFEIIEAAGDFKHISLCTMNSDVLIHADISSINLDLKAESLEHNITLEGADSEEFSNVSVYLDKLPKHVKMELNISQGGRIDAPQGIFKNNTFESGSGKPVISINHAKEINVYLEE